jgi:MFS family permease
MEKFQDIWFVAGLCVKPSKMNKILSDKRRFPGMVVFKDRDFLLYSLSRLLSVTAFQMETVAVSWLVYQITHSAFALGLIGLTAFLPPFCLALVTGHVADIFDRRRIIIICNAAYCLLAMGLMIFVWSGAQIVWPVFLIVFGNGVARAFSGPAGQALLPNLVAREHFSHAIAWNSSSFQTATIIGPALGGILYVFGGMVVFGCAVVLSVFAIITLMAMQPHSREAEGEKASWQRLIAGIGFIKGKPTILGAISLDLFAVLLGGATALMPVYAHDILHTGPWGLGLMRSMPALGAVVVAFFLAYRPLERKAGARMFMGVMLFGLATIGFGLSHNIYLSFGFLFVLGAADMVSVIVRQTLVQVETPDHMRGRVSAVNSVFIGASNELGEFESGMAAGLFGTVPAVVIGGLGTLIVAGLWIRWFPELWRRDRLVE